MKKGISLLAAMMVLAASVTVPGSSAAASDGYDMNIKIDLGAETKEISPYIYGINQYGNQQKYSQVKVNAVRQGGNRMTAYNWETNASNAGSDWKFSSDNNLSGSDDPADCAKTLSKEADTYDFDYKLTTLQLAGYVSADKNGEVSEAEAAPSARWNEVKLTKGSAFSKTPDLNDGVVYMDEYVNYIINSLGDSKSPTGIQGYSLDNEPALWAGTHSRIHPNPVTMDELQSKSIEMATAVKKLDPNAEIFGPALYGYTAYCFLADEEEWKVEQQANGYHWYLDCYLDKMKQASDKAGVRLLDVLDIHYYSESCRNGDEDAMQSVRTLYEEGYAENSWIGQWCQDNIPILPTIQKSIDKYYPGTKLAITEYSFGGKGACATIAQAEALGCYADAGVYLATLWGGDEYQFSGINLYTNYDGDGSSFGNMLVPTVTDDVSLSSAYSSINGTDKGTVTAMITNKDLSRSENAVVSLNNAGTDYEAAAVYAVYGDTNEIRLIDVIEDVDGNKVNVTLPACSAAMVVISDNALDFAHLELYNPDKYRQETETFDNPSSMINDNGYVEVPISDPAALKQIIITGNVTSSAGSSWGSANCAVGINAVDSAGEGFWTSKGYSLDLGNGSTATVDFDGTLMNGDVPVTAQVADGKVELQQWWNASEKDELGIEDVISVEYTKIQVVYEYDNTVSSGIKGDVNADGKLSVKDAVMLQKWIVKARGASITDKTAADVTGDGKINIFDLSVLKNMLGK